MYTEIEGNNIKLYGSIWDGDGPYIVSQISKMLNKTTPLNIHVHSPGGSVFDGNLIINAINAAKAPITMINDGLAASMMSGILIAGKKVKMVRNGFIMIHPPSGYQSGNASEFESTAKLLRSMESNFVDHIINRTGKSKEDAEKWMVGDNWFSAEEALAEGLIDEIIDPVITDKDLSAFKDSNVRSQFFAEMPEDHRRPNHNPTPETNQNTDMKIEAKALEALGLKPDASEAEINAAIHARETKLNDLQAKMDAQAKTHREKIVDAAIATGKILASERDQYLADATSNIELVERTLDKLPTKKSLSASIKDDKEVVADGREDWNFQAWKKKDLAGLMALKKSDPERYEQLLSNK